MEKLKDRFVLGFAFNRSCDQVLLISKLRPEWQKGYLNGIGGSIEEGESSLEAINRECMEETGLILDWKQKGVMYGTNNDGNSFKCHIFYSYDSEVFNFKQREDETLTIYPTNLIESLKTIANLKFLIPYGICKDGSDVITIHYS